ncbi:MAG: hypothetical protein ACXVXT_08335 [Blastococcus sp.]
MVSPAPATQTITREQLELALRRMQSAGTWSPDQAAALLAEIDRTTPPAATGTAARPARAAVPLANRLAEAAAYAGAVLVGAAGALLAGQNWEALGRPGRAAVLGGVTVVLAVVGGIVAAVRPRGRSALLTPSHAVRRRLASTALTLATVTAAATAAVLASDHQPLFAGLVAVVAIAVAEWVAPSAVSEIAALGAVILLAAAVLGEADASPTVVVLTMALVGLAWVALSRTRLLTVPPLALALGLVVTLYAGASGAFGGEGATTVVGCVVLGLLAGGGLAVYLRSSLWAPAVVGVLALAALVLRISSDSLSPVLAVLLTGLVLLGVGAVLLLRRRPTGPG